MENDGAMNGMEESEGALSAGPEQGIPPQGTPLPGAGGSGGGERPKGRLEGLAARHVMLAGACAGILAVLLAAGIFFAGFAAGKHCGGPEGGPRGGQLPPEAPAFPDQRSQPSPGREGAGRGRSDIWADYREEIAEAMAAELGISTEELRDGIAGGKTVAETAEEKGVAMKGLIAAVAAKVSEIADELAADGRITAERAEKIKSDAEEIAAMLIRRAGRPAAVPGL